MSNHQMEIQPLSREEIQAFVTAYYHLLDEHARVETVSAMVADQGLEFVVPEATLRSREEFGHWCVGGGGHPGVYNLFFHEVHTVASVDIEWPGDRAILTIVVNWQGRRGHPPAARSEWFGFDAHQHWDVVRSPETGEPLILRYLVNELVPMPGSPPP